MKGLIAIILTLSSLYFASAHEGHSAASADFHPYSPAELEKVLARFPGHVQPKVEEDYEPKGRSYFVDSLNLTIYDTEQSDNNTQSRILIAVYDIFGYHDHIKQIADTIAAGKNNTGTFRVVIPDFFRGGSPGSWEGGTNQDVRDVLSYFGANQTNGPSFGIFGFCWGGRIAVKAGQELPEYIKGAGLIHPANIVTADANTLSTPALLLPASNDLNFDEFEAIMMDQLGIDAVFHKRFSDMNHGFAGAGGNWSVPLIGQRVDQVISYSIDFFDRHV